MLSAFRTLAEARPFADTLTAARMSALQTAIGRIHAVLTQARAVYTVSGLHQEQVETFETHATDHARLPTKPVSVNEDANTAGLATDLDRQKLAFRALSGVRTAVRHDPARFPGVTAAKERRRR